MKRFLLFTIAILFIPGICLAATDDTTQTPDKRLEQKVNIKITGMPLGDFLTKLSTKTGVKMSARKDIADDKLAIYVKNLPLSDLQDAVKQVLHLHCTRKGEADKWEYEFWMDAKDKQTADESKGKEVKKLQDHMKELVDSLDLSPEEIAKKDRNLDWQLKDGESRSVLGIYGSLSRQQLNSLWRGETLEFDKSMLSPDLIKSIVAAMNRRHEEFSAMYPDPSEDNDDSYKFAGYSDVTGMQWWFEDDPDSGKPRLVCGMSVITLSKGSDGTFTSGEGTSRRYFQAHEIGEARKIATSQNAGDETAEDIPELDKKIKIDFDKPLKRYQLLAKIAEQANVDIVSDYFTCLTNREISREELQEPTSLNWIFYAALNGRFIPDITSKSDLYMLSNLEWPTLRAKEIPLRFITRWKEIQKKQGYLGMKDILEISRLSDPQIQDLHLYGLGSGYDILNNHKFLAFLDSFTPQQWTLAMSESGLPVSDLKDDQYRMLRESARLGEMTAFILRNPVGEQNENAMEFNCEAIRLERKTIEATANRCAHDYWTFGTIRKNGSATTSLDVNLWPDESNADPLGSEEIIELSKP